jgi:precorrin-6Y C5,15-methyltransferase (decarboxylating)
MRAGGRTIGIENNPDRMAMAARNAALLGVPELALISGEAPAALEGLDAPDAVFVGGGSAVSASISRRATADPGE